MPRYPIKQLVSQMKQYLTKALSEMSQYPIGHVVSRPLPWLHLVTSNGVTHAGWQDQRSSDGNDARTLCGLPLHHCDLSRCRHSNRHRGRMFSKLIPPTSAEIDCMACVSASLGSEEG
jgi:hypothetical protein